jgi:hypothetical protein
MDLDFLTRVQKSTALVGAVTALLVAVYHDTGFALGLLVGCLWGIGNFYALGLLLRAVVTPKEVNRNRAFIFIAIKFPVLYVGGFFILRSEWFSPISLLVGFSLLFAVVLLKAGGRAIMRLNDRPTSDPTPTATKR